MTDEKKFTGESWQLLVTSGIFDYLPIWAPFPPADPAGSDVNITQGQGTFTRLEKKTNRQKYRVEITSPNAVAELQTYYFPGWKIFVDGVEQNIDPTRDSLLGRIQVDLTSGNHEVVARFTDTPIRSLSNALSLTSWSILVLYLIYRPKSVRV
jgi:hypothetical protein